MPALNFTMFVDAVESGDKRQTIRAYRSDGRDAKPGDPLYLFAGMRSTACRRLAVAPGVDIVPHPIAKARGIPERHVPTCRSVMHILIGFDGMMYWARSRSRVPFEYSWRSACRVARADGFGSLDEMVPWFRKTHGLPFAGVLTRW